MTDLVLLSDLHLGPGYDPARGAWDPLEPFFYDDAFARFIDHVIARARHEGRSLRLVLLGDLLDFRVMGVGRPCHGDPAPATTAAASRAVATIARGHPTVFTALGRLLSAGFDVEVVVGNHDVELVSPAVQDALRETLLAHADDESPARSASTRGSTTSPGSSTPSTATSTSPSRPWPPSSRPSSPETATPSSPRWGRSCTGTC